MNNYPHNNWTLGQSKKWLRSEIRDKGQRIMAFGIMLIVIGGIVALLAGCETAVEPESQQGTQGSVSTFWATTVDDRRIPCVWQSMGNHAGGLSCDWSLK